MSIDFFDTTHKTSSNSLEFGLCDDLPKQPAYIDNNIHNKVSKWIGIVNNLNAKNVDFYPIDNCLEIKRPNGELESRCDGMLHQDNNLIFVELKDRGSNWLKKGCEQLVKTINVFKIYHDISNYSKIEAYVCNKQKPLFNTGNITHIQKFKDDTGSILNIKQIIDI